MRTNEIKMERQIKNYINSLRFALNLTFNNSVRESIILIIYNTCMFQLERNTTTAQEDQVH